MIDAAADRPGKFLSRAGLAALVVVAGAAAGFVAGRYACPRGGPAARLSGDLPSPPGGPPPSGDLIHQALPLEQVLPEVNLGPSTLGEAIDAIRRLSGANIVVDWRSLNAWKVTRDTPAPLDLRLRNVTVGQALTAVVKSVTSDAGCEVRDGIITVSADYGTNPTTVLRWYYVQDLLDAPGRTDDYSESWGAATPTAGPTDPKLRRGAALISLIQRTIDPDGWMDMGGATGSIDLFAGRLIIRNTPAAHRQIDEMLRKLRQGP